MANHFSIVENPEDQLPSASCHEDLADGDIGAAYADVTFNAAVGSVVSDDGIVFNINGRVGCHVSGEATTQDATYTVLIRASPQSGWATLAEKAVTAGTPTTVYHGAIWAHQMKVQVKYTTSDGGTGAVGVSLK